MIETTLYQVLTADGELAQLVSKYNNVPAVFLDFAPEKAVLPYIVFDVVKQISEGQAVDTFTITVDYFDIKKSKMNSIKAMQRVEFILDNKTLTSDWYDPIRVWYMNSGAVPEPDVTVIHNNIQFMARAGRKAWAEQL